MTKHNYIPGKAYKKRNGDKSFFIGENHADGVLFPLVFSARGGCIHSMRYDGTYAPAPNQEHEYDIIGEWPPEPITANAYCNVWSLFNDIPKP